MTSKQAENKGFIFNSTDGKDQGKVAAIQDCRKTIPQSHDRLK